MVAIGPELRGVRKKYGNKIIADDFDLLIKAGEMVAITGPSGSGKSTLLNLLGLLDSPDAGEVWHFGKRAPRANSSAATLFRRNHLGYLFQNYALIDNASVAYNLNIALTYAPRGTPKRERIADALTRVGLPGFEAREVYSLSGGEQQRVSVARLIVKDCAIILADEPTGSLDSENRDIVLGLLQEMNRAGTTMIIATHEEAVAEVCTKIVRLPL